MLLEIILVVAALFWIVSQMVAMPPWVGQVALVLWVVVVTVLLAFPVLGAS